jgi:hypothetical protein
MSEAQRTLDAIRKVYEGSVPVENADMTNTGIGIGGVDLRPVAMLSVANTEFSDRFIPRIQGAKAPSVSGKIIQGTTGVASGRFGTAEEGKRGGSLSISGTNSGSFHKTISVEQGVTDEAILMAQDPFDPYAAAADWCLVETKRVNHRFNLFGRTNTASDAFAAGALTSGAAPTPTALQSTGGSIADATMLYSIVPLTGEAAYRCGGYPINGFTSSAPAAGAELLDYTRTNADGTTTTEVGGTGQKSAERSITVSAGGGTAKVVLSWTPTVGAVGYAVFAGTVSGTLYFQGIVPTAYAEHKVYVSGANYQANTGNFTADNSVDALQYDGILTRLMKTGSGADLVNLTSGSTFTANARGGIVEIDAMLARAWAKFKGFSYKYMAMSGNTQTALMTALFGSPSTSKVTYLQDASKSDPLGLTNSRYKTQYGSVLEIVIDPYIPDGIILFGTDVIPSAVGGGYSAAPVSFVYLRDYWGDDWARVTRSRRSAVHLQGSIFVRAPAIYGVLGNILV